jgi:hypothetical protein
MNNPWISLWLGRANAMTSSALGQAASVGQRQFAVISAKATEDLMNLWLTPWVQPARQQRRKAR